MLSLRGFVRVWLMMVLGSFGMLRAQGVESEKLSTSTLTIAVSGDLLGHVIGTVSRDEGKVAAGGASVVARGTAPSGAWQREVQADAAGMFQFDLPLSSSGKLDLTASTEEDQAQLSLAAGDVPQALTPRPEGKGTRLPLNGKWDFMVDPPADFLQKADTLEWKTIPVPAHWEMEGFVAETGKGLYRRSLKLDKGWEGKRIKLRAESICNHAQVWMNGVYVGGHVGGATPFELDLTDAAKPGAQNTLLILVDEQSPAKRLDNLSYYAYYHLSGIWRSLELFAIEPAHVRRLAIETDLDADYRNAELIANVTLVNEQATAVSAAELKLALRDGANQPLEADGLTTTVALGAWESKTLRLKAQIQKPALWNAEQPNLYQLQTELSADKGEPTRFAQAIGFREVVIEDAVYKINGKPVKLWGACHHDAHPLRGRAVTAEITHQDLELMKAANHNALRTSHYPPHPSLPGLADSMGIYVESEAPFCFVSQPYAGDRRLIPTYIATTSEAIERDRNHPSIVMWSSCNESDYNLGLQASGAFIKRSDPTRPLGAGQSSFTKDQVDIATYHNPSGMFRIESGAKLGMPVLLDEAFAVFHGWNKMSHILELDPSTRDLWAGAPQEVVAGIYAAPHMMGAMIWAWGDDQTLVPNYGIKYTRGTSPGIKIVDQVYKLPGRGIVGDTVWGLVDGWRRPRPELWLSKKLFTPVQIAEAPLAIPAAGAPVRVPVTSHYSFANLSALRCKWTLGAQEGELRADVAPLSQGIIEIPVQTAPKPEDMLTLEFYDAQGRLVDGYHLAFQPRPTPAFAAASQPARVKETLITDFMMSDDATRLVGEDSEFAFSRTTGELLWALAGRETILQSGPMLHVVRNFASTDSIATSYTLTKTSLSEQDGWRVLEWQGNHGTAFTGGYTFRANTAGELQIDYNFTYHGPGFIAREVGLAFELPLDFTHLSWDRKADWSYYPADHLSRPQGSAEAFVDVAQTPPMKWLEWQQLKQPQAAGYPWRTPLDRAYEQDQHAWGSNDFRGTKRNIYEATLVNDTGAGLRVLGDGKHHVRATVGSNRMQLKIMDYYGGSPTEDDWVTMAYGLGREIKDGEVLSGVVRVALQGPETE